MGVFISVLSNNPLDSRFINEQRVKQLETSLNIEYQDKFTFLSEDKKIFLLNFSRDNHLYSTKDQIAVVKANSISYVTALQGYIWEKDQFENIPLNATDLSEKLKCESCEQIRNKCNGEYSIIKLSSNGECLVFNDRLSVEPIYYAKERGRIIISNRLRLIKDLLEIWNYDIETLNWLAVVGYIIGNDTSIKQIKRLDQGAYIQVQNGQLNIYENNLFMFNNQDIKEQVEKDEDAFIDESIKHCVKNVSVSLEKIPTVPLPLSGGKDSRAVLALILKADKLKCINAYTNGVEVHPDVIVAKEIAKHYSVHHVINEPERSGETSVEDILLMLMGSVFQTDGMLGLWDARGYYIPQDQLIFAGHIGEVYRGGYWGAGYQKADFSTVDNASKFFHHINLFDPAKVMRNSVRTIYERLLRKRIEYYLAHGAKLTDIPAVIYTVEHVPSSEGVLRRNDGYSGILINPLNTENFIKLAFLQGYEQREMGRIHFEIINRTDSWLTELPFANFKWDVRLEKYAHGRNLGAQPVPVPKNIPTFGSWQHEINQSSNLRLKIWEIVSSYNNSPIWNYFDRSSVQRKILFSKMNFLELIGIYGFLTNFFFIHGIEIPMKIQLPLRYQSTSEKHFVPIQALGSKTVFFYDGTKYKQVVKSWDDFVASGASEKEIINLPHWCVDVMRQPL